MSLDGVKALQPCCESDGTQSGEPIAVAFANTACSQAATSFDGPRVFEQLLQTLVSIGAIDTQVQKLLQTRKSNGPTAVAKVLAFRGVILDVLESMRQQRPISAKTLAVINETLLSCGCRRVLQRDADGMYRTDILFEIDKPADLLMPLASSLADLVASVDTSRVKQCKEERCSCYFVDTSKNRTRAWCSMSRCGNRQKVSKYYERSKLKPKRHISSAAI